MLLALTTANGNRLTEGTQQQVKRHTQRLGLEIPKSIVDRRKGAEGQTLAPETAHFPEDVAPELFDMEGILSYEQVF